MSTEVVHGPKPRFRTKLAPGRFAVTLHGRYTKVPGMAAAGATKSSFNSDRPEKRIAELRVLRTAFIVWYLEAWVAQGGDFDEGVKAIIGYPFQNVRQRIEDQAASGSSSNAPADRATTAPEVGHGPVDAG